MTFTGKNNNIIEWAGKALDFSRGPFIMGVLNCTPDSFYPGSRKATLDEAVDTAMDMVACGVHIIDVGGESSRPGAETVTLDMEIDRVIPVIEAIRKRTDIIISIDTTKSKIAEMAINSGADMVNDISGLKFDPALKEIIARYEVPVIIMHIRGNPRTMQQNPYYKDTIKEICSELSESIQIALNAGIKRNKIIIDPGIGFGKRVSDNIIIIRNLKELSCFHLPILIGLSRKSFIGHILNNTVEERLTGTITANTIAVMNGADIIRIHDYNEAVEMIRIIRAIYPNNSSKE